MFVHVEGTGDPQMPFLKYCALRFSESFNLLPGTEQATGVGLGESGSFTLPVLGL